MALGAPALPAEVEALLRAVRPSKWRGSKVSGIDLASDFVWIDDDPRHIEIAAQLRTEALSHSWGSGLERGNRRSQQGGPLT